MSLTYSDPQNNDLRHACAQAFQALLNAPRCACSVIVTGTVEIATQRKLRTFQVSYDSSYYYLQTARGDRLTISR